MEFVSTVDINQYLIIVDRQELQLIVQSLEIVGDLDGKVPAKTVERLISEARMRRGQKGWTRE